MSREESILRAALRSGLTFELPPTKLFKFAELITQRKPLTDEEIDALPLPPSGTATVRDMVRLIERAHGIGGEA